MRAAVRASASVAGSLALGAGGIAMSRTVRRSRAESARIARGETLLEILNRTRMYLVSLAGLGPGHGVNGGFTVTVRSPGSTTPSLPPGGSSGFVFVPAGDFLLGERRNPTEAHFA